MDRPRFVVSLGVFALCWLMAGPGGVALQLSLACRMEQMHQAQHHHHTAPKQHADGPCVCDQMGGGLDLTVSPTLPPIPAAGPWITAAVVTEKGVSPFPLPSSPVSRPPTPPPDARALA